LKPYEDADRIICQYVVVEVGQDCPVPRDELVESLQKENVIARKYFWPGCHHMKPYRDLFPDAGRSLPNTALVADRVLLLPTGTTVTAEMVGVIGEMIAKRVGS
jgi:dTDP-4-amino-4,6-dideoxygalactose transaminase